MAEYGKIKYHNLSVAGGSLMPVLSQTIIENTEPSYIETYLKQKGFVRTEDEKGQALKYWVDSLLSQKKINISEFEDFLFEELFWGKRKTICI